MALGKGMGRVIRWVGWAVGLLLLAALLAWSISRAMGPGRAHRDALVLVQTPWDAPGRNAFDALWLMPYAVPAGEIEAVASHDMQRFMALPMMHAPDTRAADAFTSAAARSYANELPDDDDRDLFCLPHDADACLAKVRADPLAYRALVDRYLPLLERHARLADHGHLRNRMPARLDAPFPDFSSARLALTRNALLFAEGESDAALDATCREFETWRRLGAQTDMLVANMAAISYSSGGNGVLFAAMLRELPREHALPASCRIAMRPPRLDELSMCRAMRGEHAFTTQAMQSMPEALQEENPLARVLAPLLFNREKTEARLAMAHARYCDAGAESRLVGDVPFDEGGLPAFGLLEFGCLDNAVGCILASIAAPAYHGYQNRLLDHGERLRALATLVWLREQPEGDASLAARPDELKSPARNVDIGGAGDTLRIRNYDTTRGEHWQIPLPPYLAVSSRD